MNKLNKIITALILAVFIALPMVPGPSTSNMWGPQEAQADGAITNPVGTNMIVKVAREQNPAVVWVESVKKVKRMDFKGSDNPLFKKFPDFPNNQNRGGGTGSGFIIDPEGYIITNNHVVEGSEEIKVRLLINGQEKYFKAELVGADPKTDIALLKIQREDGDTTSFPYIPLGNSDNLQVGEWVIAIGNPYGLSHTVTTGIVSAKGRDIGSGPYDEYIQTDASINPGNSGGPLLNLKGEVIGINTAIISGRTGGNVGIGFAIPINVAVEIIKDLKAHGKVNRGWLGVMIQNLTPDLANSFSLKTTKGALISEILPNGPAFKGGLQRGDVIVEYDGHPVKDISALPRLVAKTKPGQSVDLVVIRDGKRQVIKITIDVQEEKEA